MVLEKKFLRSRFARQIFTLFVLCALLPVALLAIQSHCQVTRELDEQTRHRIRQWSKNIGMNILEKLHFLETELELTALSLRDGGILISPSKTAPAESDQGRFSGMLLVRESGVRLLVFGFLEQAPPSAAAAIQNLQSGKTAIFTDEPQGSHARVFMVRSVDPLSPESGFLIGEVNTAYLWGIGAQNTLPPMTKICVFDEEHDCLVNSLSSLDALLSLLLEKLHDSPMGVFDCTIDEGTYLTGYWTIFLKGRFQASNWVVTLSQSLADVRAPIANFKNSFSMLILLCLLIVLLLSLVFIRRSLVPLEILKEGTKRIAEGDFENRLVVKSNDEFEELADTFNNMSAELERHFRTLNAMAEIDRGILSSLDTETIVHTVLNGIHSCFGSNDAGVLLIDAKQPDFARVFSLTSIHLQEGGKDLIEFPLAQFQGLLGHQDHLLLKDLHGRLPPFLKSLFHNGSKSALILPFLDGENLRGVLTIGFTENGSDGAHVLIQARRLADQMAVALSNSALVEKLDRLNWGTLHALARTVDAKSRWTAGHSQRVTNMSVRIGRALGLPRKELFTLQRASLLHDIGKIGIPSQILNKAGKLTPKEYQLVMEHPLIGVRIIEPLEPYADVIPIVHQHHEKYDGSGYPRGLAGEDIAFGARILAVADAFDAIISDRPYRSGRSLDEAVQVIKQDAGTHFDPSVVSVFLRVLQIFDSPSDAVEIPRRYEILGSLQ